MRVEGSWPRRCFSRPHISILIHHHLFRSIPAPLSVCACALSQKPRPNFASLAHPSNQPIILQSPIPRMQTLADSWRWPPDLGGVWRDSISRVFLEPYGIQPNKPYAWDAEAASNRSGGMFTPGAEDDDFILLLHHRHHHVNAMPRSMPSSVTAAHSSSRQHFAAVAVNSPSPKRPFSHFTPIPYPHSPSIPSIRRLPGALNPKP